MKIVAKLYESHERQGYRESEEEKGMKKVGHR
jgi:hypothetical protein